MNEIICPNCNKAFKVDETGYADILKQVRDFKFDEEIRARLDLADRDKNSAIELVKSQMTNTVQGQLSKKEQEINELKAINANAEMEKQLSILNAIKGVEKERDDLASSLKSKELEQLLLEKSLQEKFLAELKAKEDIIKLKDEEINLRKDMKQKL